MAGLEKAIAIVEIEEEKPNQSGDPPQPSPRPAHDSTKKIPRLLQRITEREEELTREDPQVKGQPTTREG